MRTIFALLLAITLLAAGLLILIGETSEELWATREVHEAPPTLTVTP